MFGTCGIRKIFSNYSYNNDRFTPIMALELGLSLGSYLKQNDQDRVIIGHDVRTTAVPIELALSSGLISTGIQVYQIGLVTTPTLCLSIDKLNSKCGIMITASHNPPEYIGIKIFGPHGLGYSSDQESEIEQIYQTKSYKQVSWDQQGTIIQIQRMNETHIKHILRRAKYQNHLRKFNVVMDPGNGAASIIGPQLLGNMGLKYITLNSQPDGHFPGRNSEPSEEELIDLSNIVRNEKGFELGIAFDGDADRVVFIDEKGALIEPIRVLTFLAREYIREKYPEESNRPKLSVVTPVNSSGVIEHILEPMGVKVYRTKVGDINVSQLMQKTDSFIGGENCGVYICPEFSGHWGPDTLMPIVILMKYLGKYKTEFSQLLADIPEFPYIKTSMELNQDRILTHADYQNIGQKLREALEKAGYSQFIENYEDGFHIRFNQGWILIRKSGTTPIIRITAESIVDIEKTRSFVELGRTIVKELYEMKENL